MESTDEGICGGLQRHPYQDYHSKDRYSTSLTLEAQAPLLGHPYKMSPLELDELQRQLVAIVNSRSPEVPNTAAHWLKSYKIYKKTD
jgi:hypothetical protein